MDISTVKTLIGFAWPVAIVIAIIMTIATIYRMKKTYKENKDIDFFRTYMFTIIGILCSGLFFAFVPVVDAHLPMLPRFFQGLLFGIGTVFTFLFLSMSLCHDYSIGTRVKVWLTVIGFTVGAPLFVSMLAFSFPNIPYTENNFLMAMLGFGFGGIAVIPLLGEN